MPEAACSNELSAFLNRWRRTGLIRRLLELARDEDIGSGDITVSACGQAGPWERKRASIKSRSNGTLAGLAFIPDCIAAFGSSVCATLIAGEGDLVRPGQSVCVLEGPAAEILVLERTVLNLVGRLSGIASRTAEFVTLVKGTRARICDTRKTTPGLRCLEKYAVLCGGGVSHRMGLFDAVLIKDNHLAGIPDDALAEYVAKAATAARAFRPPPSFVEVEVDRLEQLESILSAGGCGVDMVLLDNMPIDLLSRAVSMRDSRGSRILLEASGGVSLETVHGIALSGVDRISVGGLTHQAVSLDFGLDAEADS